MFFGNVQKKKKKSNVPKQLSITDSQCVSNVFLQCFQFTTTTNFHLHTIAHAMAYGQHVYEIHVNMRAYYTSHNNLLMRCNGTYVFVDFKKNNFTSASA